MRPVLLGIVLFGAALGGCGEEETPPPKEKEDPVRCGDCPINAGMSVKGCCGPYGENVACIWNFQAPVGPEQCRHPQAEMICYDFDLEVASSKGCALAKDPSAPQCRANFWDDNPACCYEAPAKFQSGRWVGADGRLCDYANCDGGLSCP